MSTHKRTQTPLKTEVRLNYEMLFAGKVRTFPKVTITFSSFDSHECISIAEINRLNFMIKEEVLNNTEPLLIGEVHTLMSVYKIDDDYMFCESPVDDAEYKRWRYEWDYVLPQNQSNKIKKYFKSLKLPNK